MQMQGNQFCFELAGSRLESWNVNYTSFRQETPLCNSVHISIGLTKLMFDFQDLVEDFIFPASRLIIEARNGSGKEN